MKSGACTEMPGKFVSPIAAAILVLAGCAAQLQRSLPDYRGKKSAAEALATLSSRSEKAVPLRANGRCSLQYYVEGEQRKENFAVKLWVSPPRQIRLQGDIAFDPKGIVLGSNADEFWLSMKPKEISSYWWGKWSDKEGTEMLMIDPKTLLEAFGMAGVDSSAETSEDWSLSNQGGFDVLTKRDGGAETQKIYVSHYGYLVSRIVYLDDDGQAAVTAELDEHREVAQDFFVPTVIKIIKGPGKLREDFVSITIKLSSVRTAKLTEKQREHLFGRPEPKGFAHVYRIIGDNIIEQP